MGESGHYYLGLTVYITLARIKSLVAHIKMKQHICLLGPPAVGKLSVGNVLSTHTDLPLYDNARAIDIASLLFPYGSEQFRTYRDDLRFDFFNRAISSDINGLISTGCLARTSWPHFIRIESLLACANWNTRYILLTASEDALVARARSSERLLKRSLISESSIKLWLRENWPPRLLEGLEIYQIDTSNLTLEATVVTVLTSLRMSDESERTA